jgi:hypothetical protein
MIGHFESNSSYDSEGARLKRGIILDILEVGLCRKEKLLSN